jgi:hypothetical protein
VSISPPHLFLKSRHAELVFLSTTTHDTMSSNGTAAHISPADAAAGDTTTKAPDTKKQKMEYPMAPDEDWPEAWLMPTEVEDQCKENRLSPNVPFAAADMKKLGIAYWKMDAESFEYPSQGRPLGSEGRRGPQVECYP